MNTKEIYALGVGASTTVLTEIAIACGYSIAGLYHYNDTRTGEHVNGMRILGSFDDLFSEDISGVNFLLTMGEPKIRKELTEKITNAGGILPTMIHPTAIISPNCKISQNGVIISPLVEVQSNSEINDGVLIRSMALVCHNAIVDSYVFVGPKALIGAFVHVSSLAFIGQASVLVSRKVKDVGSNALVGAGAVVTKSVEECHVVVGQPAKTIKILKND